MEHNQAESSFKLLLSSLRDRYNYVFGGLLLIKALGAWLYAMVKFPGIPLSALVIYRNAGNDMTYLPIISGLGKAGLREPFVQEMAGTGVMQFPLFSALPLTLLSKLFGPAGFVAADIIFLFATFASLAILLRLLGAASLTARCLALLAVTNVFYLMGQARFRLVSQIEPALLGVPAPANPGYFLQTPWLQHGIPLLCALALATAAIILVFGREPWKRRAFGAGVAIYVTSIVLICSYFFVIWGWRMPRPLVTGVPLYAGLASLVCLMRFATQARTPWIMFGVCWAVLAQSYIYAAFLLGIAALGVLAFLLATKALPLRILIRNLGFCVAVIVPLCVPLAFQQLADVRPDLFQRFGGFPLPRLSFPHFWPESPEIAAMGLSAMMAFMVLYRAGREIGPRLGGGVLLTWLLAASLLSLPLSVLVAGRTIQVGHFLEQYYEILSLGMAALLAFALDMWRAHTTTPRAAGRITATIVATSCLAATGAIAIESRRPNVMETAVREDFTEYAAFPNYRRDFNALVLELRKPQYRNEILGSLDVQVQSWWTSFGHGNVFLPDVFSTTMTDTEIETRLILFCKQIKIDEEEFMALISDPAAQIFFLSHAKYMASALHTYAPLSAYSADDQTAIRQTSIFSSFNLFIPTAEKNRLRQKFARTEPSASKRALDLVLLFNSKRFAAHSPGPGFAPVYSNETFRLWRRVNN